jgi:ABC-2 type transport system permease protein
MTALVATEWLKLRTTRLLYGMIPAAVLLSCAAVAGEILRSGDAATLESDDGIRQTLAVTGTGAILVLVVGIIMSAGEYRYGTAADTFLTTPRRHHVIVAKLATAAGVGLGLGVITCVAAVAIATLLYNSEGATFPVDDVEVWLTLAGALVYTTIFAVLGAALGALIRNQVLAVTAALGWIGVVEHTFVNLLPDLGRWFPFGAGQAIVRTPIDGLLPPLGGIAVLAAYGAVAAVAGIRAVATRDA